MNKIETKMILVENATQRADPLTFLPAPLFFLPATP